MTFVVREHAPAGNVVSCAWAGDHLALLMRSGHGGPLRGFVLDANGDHRVVCSLDLSHHRALPGAAARIELVSDAQVVVAADGHAVTAFDAVSGRRLSTHELIGIEGARYDEERAIPLGCQAGSLLVGWCGKTSGGWQGELRAVDLETGDVSVVLPGFFGGPSDALAIPLPGGDVVVLDDDVRRLTRSGKVKWRRAAPAESRARHASSTSDAGTVVVYVDGQQTVHAIETKRGAAMVRVPAASIRSAGITNAGDLWLLSSDGRLALHDVATGELRRSVGLGALTLGMVMAPDDVRALVLVDKLKSRTEARVVDVSTGKTTWRTAASFGVSGAALTQAALFVAGDKGVIRIDRATNELTVVHRRSTSTLVAAPTGDIAFVSGGAVYFVSAAKKGKPRSMGKVRGDTLVEIATDGRQIAFSDERAVTVVDTRTARPTLSLRQTALEAYTIDPPDDLRFDARGDCLVIVGTNKAYRLARAGASPVTRKLTPPPRDEGAEVGPDEVIRLRFGRRTLRVHVAASGRAALVEDGEALDLVGPAPQARRCRLIEEGGLPVGATRLSALMRAGMLRDAP